MNANTTTAGIADELRYTKTRLNRDLEPSHLASSVCVSMESMLMNLYACCICALLLFLSRLVGLTRLHRFTREIYILTCRDLGSFRWDPGQAGWPDSHLKTKTFSVLITMQLRSHPGGLAHFHARACSL